MNLITVYLLQAIPAWRVRPCRVRPCRVRPCPCRVRPCRAARAHALAALAKGRRGWVVTGVEEFGSHPPED